MEELLDSCIGHELTEQLKMMSEFRQSYSTLKDDLEKSQKINFLLKNMLMIAQNNEKQQTMYRNYSESIVLKQNKIIENFINLKEENQTLKEEIDNKEEMLQSSYREIDELRKKTTDEIKLVQDIHEEELAHCQDQYLQLEKQLKEEFELDKQRLETSIKELKQNVENLNNEKNILVAVTVRDYEDQIQSLQDALHGAKMELQSTEEMNYANISMYKKKLEDQEKHYMSILEKIQSEVTASTTASTTTATLNKSRQKHQLSGTTNLSSMTSTASSASNYQQKRLQESSAAIHSSTEQSHISSSRSSVQQPVFTSQSELFVDSHGNLSRPVNSSYYERLQIPPPSGLIQVVPKHILCGSHAVASTHFNDDICKDNSDHLSKENVQRQMSNRFSEKSNISVHNYSANKNTNYLESKDILLNNNGGNTDCNHENRASNNDNNNGRSNKLNYPVSKKRKLYDPTSFLL